MKCVVQNTVFETDKITLMKKKLEGYEPSIYIEFDNGQWQLFSFGSVKECEEEWQRIMKCWRSNELQCECLLTGGV